MGLVLVMPDFLAEHFVQQANDTKQRMQSLMTPGRLLWAKRLEQTVLFVL